MTLALKSQPTGFDDEEIRMTLTDALRREAEQARLRRDHYADLCRAFERAHGWSSDEFLIRFERGDIGDDAYTFDWYAAKRGLDLWDRRFRILSGVVM
jgi:hypothetical protein